ncbi:MAG TPA: hypothetical protein DCS93_12285 [Microscillaceae bacterium]|nr:hypothetical protein [Microscillaceae bacterium]
MKKTNQPKKYHIRSLDYYVLRTPLLPFNSFPEVEAIDIEKLLEDPLIREAIYLSSPTLLEALQQWIKNGVESPKEEEKLKISLLKYLFRMSFRPTPFGLMAGVSIGKFGSQTQVTFAESQHNQRHTRLDMGFLGNFAIQLAENTDIKPHLKYYPNPTLYQIGDYLRYIEYRLQDKGRTLHLVDVEDSEFIQLVVQHAQKGATIKALADLFVDEETTQEEAVEFIEALIESQVLLSELEPTVTGEEFLGRLIKILEKLPAKQQVTQALRQIAQQITAIDQQPLGVDVARYRQIQREIEALTKEIQEDSPPQKISPRELFQVDMQNAVVQNTLHPQVAEEIAEAVEWLMLIRGASPNMDLESFKVDFRQKYEQQAVPLLQVLDNEVGLGYPIKHQDSADFTPLVDDLVLIKNGRTANSALELSQWTNYLQQKYYEALHQGRANLELSKHELEKLFNRPDDIKLAPTFCFLGSVLASSSEAVDRGEFQVAVTSAGGASVGKILGRFCYEGEELTDLLKQTFEKEQAAYPEAVFAEVVHLPMARLGNVLQRAVLRDYEIPVMATAAVEEEYTITLDDLWLKMQGDRLILFSKRLGKEVIPRLSSAHNFEMKSIPVYYFLCDLQAQFADGVTWSWLHLQNADWLPRVTLGKAILSKARWKVKAEDLKKIREAEDAQKVDKMQALRTRLQIPQQVTAVFGDNKLPLDLSQLWPVKILLSLYKSSQNAILEESLFSEQNLLAQGPAGGFTNEIVVPFHYTANASEENAYRLTSEDLLASTHQPITREFPLGSEWFYIKIYCGAKIADQIITQAIKPVADQLLSEQIIEEWFFLRYIDPKNHLRIRFKGQGMFYAQVIASLHQALDPFVTSGLVSNFHTDTYVREVERYGATTMELSEKLFFHDSEMVAQILSLFEGEEIEEFRWLLALRGADAILADFGLNLSQRCQMMESMKDNFAQDFNFTDKSAKKQLSQKYREARTKIEDIMVETYDNTHPLAAAFDCFHQRSHRWKDVVQDIRAKCEALGEQNKLNTMLPSYIHMMVNRLLRSKQRIHEVVLYDFLFQHYRSAIARAKKQKKDQAAMTTENR